MIAVFTPPSGQSGLYSFVFEHSVGTSEARVFAGCYPSSRPPGTGNFDNYEQCACQLDGGEECDGEPANRVDLGKAGFIRARIFLSDAQRVEFRGFRAWLTAV